MPTFDPAYFDSAYFDAGPSVSTPLSIFRNGSEELLTLNNEQLGALSLGMAAFDGQIGMGQIVVGGDPGWVAGDRITVYGGSALIYTGFVMDHSRSRGSEPLDFQTTYQLMDANRQLIGRKVVDHVSPTDTAGNRFTEFFEFIGDLTLDETWVYPDETILPTKTYTGDGFMDLIADEILYTGNTAFMTTTQTENEFAIHFHPLSDGIRAGLRIVDDQSFSGTLGVEYGGVPVTFGGVPVRFTLSSGLPSFPPQNPVANFSAADLKNDNEVRNGIVNVAGGNAGSMARHGAGGLKFQAVLDYSGINEESLVQVANTILSVTGADERPSYTCTIGPLTGEEAILIPPGSVVGVTSAVFGGTSAQRVAHVTLTMSKDERGQAVPGYWDAALELAYPLRLPASVPGFGGQGGDSGRLSDPPVWTSTQITYDDPGMPAGSSTTVTAQLVDQDKIAVPTPDVTLTWTLYQWEDEGETVPGSDYSLAETTSTTDISGLALNVITHVTDGAVIKWWVTAGP